MSLVEDRHALQVAPLRDAASRASLLDQDLQHRLGPLSDAARLRIEAVVVAGFSAGLLDHDTARDLARGLQWARSGRAPADTLGATIHGLTGVSRPATELQRMSRLVGRRPRGSVRCPDVRSCECCIAAQELVDAGHRIAVALVVVDSLERTGMLPATRRAPAADRNAVSQGTSPSSARPVSAGPPRASGTSR
jgi:hypothetical protein